MVLLRATVLSLAISAPLLAQYQAANGTARRSGLEVRAIEFNNPAGNVPDLITVNGPAGAPYVTWIELGGAFDRSLGYPLFGGNTNPFIIDIVTGRWRAIDNLLVPAWTGVIPATGSIARTFPFPLPLPPGLTFRCQAIVLDPLSPLGLAPSNGVIKTVTPALARPNWVTPYQLNAPAAVPATAYQDVEQADFDGDGDHDVLLLECGTGQITASFTVGGSHGAASAPIAVVPMASCLELADIDNDNWLDLLVAIDGVAGMQAFKNLGRPIIPGSTVLGPWAGFAPAGVVAWDPNILQAPYSLDIESADVDQDGYIDVVLACARPQALGLPNRLLRNMFGMTGAIGFQEITVPNLFPSYPAIILDDSEDIEFSDLDADGDMDMVVANYDGPAAPIGIGVELVHINMGFAQGGPIGTYKTQTIVPNPLGDESVDVMVKDFDGDGYDDIYVSNWYFTAGNTGAITAIPVPDALYLTQGTPLAWVNMSFMLPDNPAYVGPPAFALPAFASSDAEATDADLWTPPNWGANEILVSSGSRCNPAVAPAMGLRLLNFVPANPPFPAYYVNDSFPAGGGFNMLPAAVQQMDINDLETGDWGRTYWDQDFGLATVMGYFWCLR